MLLLYCVSDVPTTLVCYLTASVVDDVDVNDCSEVMLMLLSPVDVIAVYIINSYRLYYVHRLRRCRLLALL